jgi:hypothetical protein
MSLAGKSGRCGRSACDCSAAAARNQRRALTCRDNPPPLHHRVARASTMCSTARTSSGRTPAMLIAREPNADADHADFYSRESTPLPQHLPASVVHRTVYASTVNSEGVRAGGSPPVATDLICVDRFDGCFGAVMLHPRRLQPWESQPLRHRGSSSNFRPPALRWLGA